MVTPIADTTINTGDPGHPALHVEERLKINELAAATRSATVIDPGHNTLLAVLGSGAKHIQANPGVHTFDGIHELLDAQAGLTIEGTPDTIFRCTKTGTNLTAAFAILGTGPDRITLKNMRIDCNDNADVGLFAQPTDDAGHFEGEPDACHRFYNLWIDDATNNGVEVRTGNGTDGGTSYIRASIFRDIRVRRAGVRGFDFQAADCWIDHCEATTSSVDVANGAGLWMRGANNFVSAFKAWYVRASGFVVRGTRNEFVNCHAQDTYAHGWDVQWDKNLIVGAVADTCGTSLLSAPSNTYDGIYVAGNLPALSIQGANVFDRRPGGIAIQQRHGVNAPTAMFEPASPAGVATAGGQVRIAGVVGYDVLGNVVNKR